MGLGARSVAKVGTETTYPAWREMMLNYRIACGVVKSDSKLVGDHQSHL